MVQSRTHTCGKLRLEHAGREVDQNLTFVALRDFCGATQAGRNAAPIREQE